MKSDKLINGVFVLMGAFVCSHANAAIYKCTSYDSQLNQQNTVYTDMPCNGMVKQALVSVQTAPINVATTRDAPTLDLKVTRAVLANDFKLAKSMATTKAHWRLISMAEGKRQASVRTVPVVTAQVAARNECAVARGDFESTSRTRRRDKNLIATKKSIMFAACGVAEPVQQYRPVIIRRPYGGIQSSRWIAPSYGRKGYHRAYSPHHKKRHIRHVRNKGGLSLQYKNKHFGLRTQSGGIQKHTDIRQQFR